MEEIEGGNLVYTLLGKIFPGIHVPVDMVMSWFVMLVLIVLSALAVWRISLRPRPLQNAFEMLVEGINGLSRQIIGPGGDTYFPLFATLFIFIFCSNLIGLLPGFKSPTSNININLAMAVVVALTTQYVAVTHKGFLGYLKHFCGPPYWLAPLFIMIRVIEEFARPLSLTIRLFGNILAKEILLAILVYLTTLFLFTPGFLPKLLMLGSGILRPLIIVLGCLVSFVQALVFTALSMVYIAGAVNEH